MTEAEHRHADLDRLRRENRAQAAELAELRRRLVAAERTNAREDATRTETAAVHGEALAAGRAELAVSEANRAALAHSEGYVRAMLESSTDYAIVAADPQGRITEWNAGARAVMGWEPDEVVGRDAALIFTPEDRAAGVPEQEMSTALAEGRATDERWHLKRDGSRFWAMGMMMPLRDGAGVAIGFLKVLRDRTEQRRTEDALRESEARLRFERGLLDAVIRQAPVGISVAEAPSGRAALLNDKAREMIGHGDVGGDVHRYASYGAVHPDGRSYAVDDYPTARAIRRGEVVEGEEMLYRRGGPGGADLTRLAVSSAPVRDEAGAIVAAVTVFTDVGEQRRAEEALRESEAFARSVLESSADAIKVLDEQGRILSVNTPGLALLGVDHFAEVAGTEYAAFYPDEGRAGVRAAVAEAARGGVGRYCGPCPTAKGHAGLWDVVVTPLAGVPGHPRRLLAITRDVTARHEVEERLRESEARLAEQRTRLAALVEHLPVGVCFLDSDAKPLLSNPAYRRFLPDETLPSSMANGEERWIARAESGRPLPRACYPGARALRGEAVPGVEFLHRAPDGQETWTRVSGVPLLDAAGRVAAALVVVADIDEQKRAQDALRRLNETLEARVAERTAELRHALERLHEQVLERERAEDALRQAQKMEAVGQLTGGIAHDFNNMLQGIGGALELARLRVERGRSEDAFALMDAARKGVDRAAALTHRLLAFARRQALDAAPVAPDALVGGLAELIRRTVGPGIAVALRLGAGDRHVLCDANGLENALLNLAINARDAMSGVPFKTTPDGGTLTLATADVHLSRADVAGQDGAAPGDYVEVSVSDTGVGMTPEVAARAFEPFFTTKPIGQGTGLGLSQLYGFVRQSGGLVRLDSAPGRGTTVRIFLPRHVRRAGDRFAVRTEGGSLRDPSRDEGDDAAGAGSPERAEAQAGAGGTVLLVEDDAAVRAVAAERLRERGHRVLEAADGPAALRLLQGGRRVDLLVTDVGLPSGLNGRQVAEAAREGRPGLPVLFITGYAGSALDDRLAPGMEAIGKPFTLDALADKVRAMMEQLAALSG